MSTRKSTQRPSSDPTRVGHDINPELVEPRPPLPRWGRVGVIGYLMLIACLVVMIVLNSFSAANRESIATALALESQSIEQSIQTREADLKRFDMDAAKADEIAAWVRVGYHAQSLLLDLLQSFGPEVTVSAMETRMSEGIPQMELSFTMEGLPESQMRALAEVEKTLNSRGIRITSDEGSRGGLIGRGQSYKMVVLLPPAGGITR